MTLKGQIFSGNWDFVIAGIYDGEKSTTDTALMFFHWSYLNDEIKTFHFKRFPKRWEFYSWGHLKGKNIQCFNRMMICLKTLKRNIHRNGKSFSIRFCCNDRGNCCCRLVSYVVILIIIAVLANTMAMTARERIKEYATIRAIGFQPSYNFTHNFRVRTLSILVDLLGWYLHFLQLSFLDHLLGHYFLCLKFQMKHYYTKY